jgi:hypothetical protein
MRRFPLVALAAASAFAAPALADDPDDRATAVFSQAFAELCTGAFREDGGLVEPPQRYDVTAASSYDQPAPMALWQFRCNVGAYNLQSVFVAQSEYSGIVPLSFARPDLDVVLEDPENYEGPVKEVKITGWSASPVVVNGSFDPATGRLTATGLWRGLGDASDTAVWQLIDEGFRLVHFEVDATYDGQVNPETLADFE